MWETNDREKKTEVKSKIVNEEGGRARDEENGKGKKRNGREHFVFSSRKPNEKLMKRFSNHKTV